MTRDGLPGRSNYSLSNLWHTAGQFDSLRLFDDSEEHDTALLEPPEQCELKRVRAVWKVDEPAPPPAGRVRAIRSALGTSAQW